MKHPLLILIILGTFSISCTRDVIIPKETMVDIYHDIYLLDQSLIRKGIYRDIQDSLLIYEPVFNRYGYSSDDYIRSLNFYIERPDKFEKVFAEVKHRYEARIMEIDDSLAIEERKSVRWKLIDSVRTLGPDSSLTTLLYRCLDMMFFKQDTSLLQNYPSPDSSAMESWKLNVFELYQGNPFADTIPAGMFSFNVPDSTSLKNTGTKTSEKKSDAHKTELEKKNVKAGPRIKKQKQ